MRQPLLLFRPLIAAPGRTALSVLAIGAAVSLILLFEGFREGIYAQLRAFPEQLPTPFVVTQAGVSRIAAERSVLPQLARQQVEEVSGVREAHPVSGLPVIYEKEGRRTPVFVVAYDQLGGPQELAAGRHIDGPREIVVDESLAEKHGLRVGTTTEVVGESFTVVGLSAGTSSFFGSYVFARYDDLIDLYFQGAFAGELAEEPPLLSFLLVELEPATELAAMRAKIEEAVRDGDVHTPDELAAANVAMGRQMLGPILGLFVGISWIVGILVTGLTTYASVATRLREFAVMKAFGARHRRLVLQITIESVILAFLALLVGVAAAGGVASLVEWTAPEYAVRPWTFGGMGRTAAASLAIGVLGGLIPLRKVARVDPALVFRGVLT